MMIDPACCPEGRSSQCLLNIPDLDFFPSEVDFFSLVLLSGVFGRSMLELPDKTVLRLPWVSLVISEGSFTISKAIS